MTGRRRRLVWRRRTSRPRGRTAKGGRGSLASGRGRGENCVAVLKGRSASLCEEGTGGA